MTGFAALLTPWDRGSAIELGNRLWRKRVLPVGEITYEGRKLNFTSQYLKGLETAFRSKAYDYVPFQLAGDDNKHTNALERFGGYIKDLTLEPDGLYVTLDPTERGEQLLRENPLMGVSARIVEQYARADGQFYPAAVQHVLGTHDPRVPALGGWQAVEAANTPTLVIDLTSATFPGQQEGHPMTEYTPQQQANLSRLLNMDPATLDRVLGQQAAPPAAPPAAPAWGDDAQLTDQELADLIDALSDEDLAAMESDFYAETGAGAAATGLTAEAQMAIDLANSRADETERQLGVFQARFEAQAFESERRSLADLGIPPHITDLARPLLQGSGHTVDLANGQRADAGQVMRKVLGAVAKTVQMLDLSMELGTPADEPPGAAPGAQATQRDEIISRARQQMGL